MKDKKTYLENKHQSLNDVVMDMASKTMHAQIKDYDSLTNELQILEKRLAITRWVFYIIFILTIVTSLGITVYVSINPNIDNATISTVTGSVAGFSTETTFYLMVTNKIEKKVDELDRRRKDISDTWNRTVSESHKTISEEQRNLTKTLIDIERSKHNLSLSEPEVTKKTKQ